MWCLDQQRERGGIAWERNVPHPDLPSQERGRGSGGGGRSLGLERLILAHATVCF